MRNSNLSIGKELRRAREATGQTRKALAAKLRMSPSTITRWEKGEDHPRGNNLVAVARELKMDLAALLTAVEVEERLSLVEFDMASPRAGTAPATSSTARGKEDAEMRQRITRWTDTEFTKAVFRLKAVYDKHGPRSSAWVWITGNMIMFEGAPKGHGETTKSGRAKKDAGHGGRSQ